MISFRTFQPDAERRAHTIAKDAIALPSRVRLEGDVIVCESPTGDAVALGVQHDLGALGSLALRTCLLPQRESPYLLSLELARQRVMRLLEALEDWRLTALPTTHPAMVAIARTLEAFTLALVEGRDPDGAFTPRQAELSNLALSHAIDAGEALALECANRRLQARFEDEEQRTPQIGCCVHVERFAEPLQKLIATGLGFMTSPMRWPDIEPQEGKFSFVKTDRWIEWAVRQARIPVVAGPVLDFSKEQTPEWMHIWRHDYDTVRECVYEHATRVVTRYRRTVSRWTAVSGLNLNDDYSLSTDQMIELTRLVIHVIRKLQPSARVTVDLDQPFGDHTSRNAESVSPRLYAEMVLDSGIHVDAFGLRLQMGDGHEGRETRDLLQMARLIDDFASLERPIHVSAMGVPDTPSGVAHAGRWRQEWSPDHQARWLGHAIAIAAANHSVQSVCWQALYDLPADEQRYAMRRGALIDEHGRAKPALRRFLEVARAIHARTRPTLEAPSMGAH
ncbi:MAG: endo-1,4-beta-xylanase [Planctomycetota bacterium]